MGPTGRASIFREKNMPPADLSDPPAIFAGKEVPDSQDPPGRSVHSIVILVANVYVHIGRSRGVHVACTRTYNGQGARKKIRPRMCTYGQGLEHLLAHTYMVGSEQRNRVVVVFMGRQRNASCSSGGNKMRHVHQEATERVGANRLGRNGMHGHVH